MRSAQSVPTVRPHPLWLRCLAAFCTLLVCGAGVAQAAHIHGSWLPESRTHISSGIDSQTQTGDERCQLCQAMHSALPVANTTLAMTSPLLHMNLSVRLDRLPEVRWQFAMFSRPPPATLG
ncbi:MAG TPA: hypothetical protein VGN16_23835 [Acidobacteriaceae bacterium]